MLSSPISSFSSSASNQNYLMRSAGHWYSSIHCLHPKRSTLQHEENLGEVDCDSVEHEQRVVDDEYNRIDLVIAVILWVVWTRRWWRGVVWWPRRRSPTPSRCSCLFGCKLWSNFQHWWWVDMPSSRSAWEKKAVPAISRILACKSAYRQTILERGEYRIWFDWDLVIIMNSLFMNFQRGCSKKDPMPIVQDFDSLDYVWVYASFRFETHQKDSYGDIVHDLRWWRVPRDE